MTLNYYAISFEPTRMVANEIQAKEAAVLLDAGHSILLGTPVDMVRVALRHHKSLKIFARSDVLRASRPRPPRRSAASARSKSAVSAGGSRIPMLPVPRSCLGSVADHPVSSVPRDANLPGIEPPKFGVGTAVAFTRLA